MKRTITLFITLTLLLTACAKAEPKPEAEASLPEGTVEIVFAGEKVTVDGEIASTDDTAAVYTAHDIVFYEDGTDFTYGEGEAWEKHSAEEAAKHLVVHITAPGTYALRGQLALGQVAVDLGKEAKDDPGAAVTLILNGATINCAVAPAVIFYNVYECGSKDTGDASPKVDTSAAGAKVIVADGTVNHIVGSHVARIYKPDSIELSADGSEVLDAKKLHKYDAAFYSKMSMNLDGGAEGSGVLNIVGDNEGLGSELHLTVNGGKITITSADDGINTNEEDVSVTTINGGTLNIAVTGDEGDGIDSNGYLVINGGSLTAAACSTSMDSGIDSDLGIYINGGSVAASGNMLDRIETGTQTYAVFTFAEEQLFGSTYELVRIDGTVVAHFAAENYFTVLTFSGPELTPGEYVLRCGGEIYFADANGAVPPQETEQEAFPRDSVLTLHAGANYFSNVSFDQDGLAEQEVLPGQG